MIKCRRFFPLLIVHILNSINLHSKILKLYNNLNGLDKFLRSLLCVGSSKNNTFIYTKSLPTRLQINCSISISSPNYFPKVLRVLTFPV